MMTEVKTLFNAQSGGICPNLVEFYDAFWEDPFMYLAMEYMDCGSLATVMARHGALPEPLLARVSGDMRRSPDGPAGDRKLSPDLQSPSPVAAACGAP